jgi:hypothetical protein
MATSFSLRGDPSSSTASTGTPQSADASLAGSPIVAEQHTNVGSAP